LIAQCRSRTGVRISRRTLESSVSYVRMQHAAFRFFADRIVHEIISLWNSLEILARDDGFDFTEFWRELERKCRPHHHKHLHIRFTFKTSTFSITGDNMQFTMQKTKQVSVIGKPVTALLDPDGNPIPSAATLSNQSYTSSDSAVFTVDPDPSVPGGAIIKGVAPGTATLTETATATEPDGTTTETVQGVATIVITEVPPPPAPPAASLVFTFGTPTDQTQPQP
jgi:hypothetical protein